LISGRLLSFINPMPGARAASGSLEPSRWQKEVFLLNLLRNAMLTYQARRNRIATLKQLADEGLLSQRVLDASGHSFEIEAKADGFELVARPVGSPAGAILGMDQDGRLKSTGQ
jgi:hypothetical protein